MKRVPDVEIEVWAFVVLMVFSVLNGQDELLWGAAWLRRASENDSYLNYITTNGKTLGAEDNINEFGWDNKHAGLNVLISKVGLSPHIFRLLDGSCHCFSREELTPDNGTTAHASTS